MATDRTDRQSASAACARCGHSPLQYVTYLPRRFDQPTAFAIFRCTACGRLEWESRADAPEKS